MMYKAGVNPIEVLLWSRKRKLREVIQAMKMIANNVEIDFSDEEFVFPDLLLLDLESSEKEDINEVDEKKEEDNAGDILKCPEKGCSFSACINSNTSKDARNGRKVSIFKPIF